MASPEFEEQARRKRYIHDRYHEKSPTTWCPFCEPTIVVHAERYRAAAPHG